MAGADRRPRARCSAARRAVGDHPEADRRRPLSPRRRALRERPRPRAGAEADRSPTSSRSSLVDADGEVAHVQPRRERRALPARHRRLRPLRVVYSVRLRLRAAPQARARRRGRSIDDALAGASRSGSTTASSTATSSSRSTRARADFLAGCLLLLPPGRRRTPASPTSQRALSRDDWGELLLPRAHDKQRAPSSATPSYYLATSGQLYWSDPHQLGDYLDGYHGGSTGDSSADVPATEMITRALRAARASSPDFMAEARDDFRAQRRRPHLRHVRLIERDDETLPRRGRGSRGPASSSTCTSTHTPAGDRPTPADAFRRLIDLALERGGSFYLTYHRWATRSRWKPATRSSWSFCARKRAARPGRALPERLVPALPGAVRR